MVKVLLVANASLTEQDAAGNSPFHLAASHGHLQVVKSLLLSFARLDQRRLPHVQLRFAAFSPTFRRFFEGLNLPRTPRV